MSGKIVVEVLEDFGHRLLTPPPNPLLERSYKLAEVCKKKPEYGYEVTKSGDEYWLRRPERQKGNKRLPMDTNLARLNKSDWKTYRDLTWLRTYQNSQYGQINRTRKPTVNTDLCIKLIRQLRKQVNPRLAITNFEKGIFLSNYDDLQDLLELAFDIFFEVFPDGVISCMMLSDKVNQFFAFQRTAYALSHFQPEEFDRGPSGKGFAALSGWHSIDGMHIIPIVLSIVD